MKKQAVKNEKGIKEISQRDVAYFLIRLAILLLTAFLCFYKLDAKYVDAWDEARHGVNAYEMANGGSIIQNTYLRQADYYNLKPPISMYGIMLGFKLGGNTVWGLRFCSAMVYLFLVAIAGKFAKRFGDLESFLVMLFLALNTTAFQAHMIRSGDADSLYVFFFSMAMFAMMNIEMDVRYVYLCGLLASLAFLTKSFHALLIPAIGFVYLLITGLIKKMKVKDWLIFLAALLGPVLVWGLLRMRIDGTTFLKAMWETDVLGRTSGELKNNISPFTYYLEYFFGASSGKVTIYACALVILLIGVFRYPYIVSFARRSKWLGFALWLVVPFLAFSLVTNKLIWYVYPALIPLLMVAGIFTAKLIQDKQLGKGLRIIASIITCFLVVYFARQEVLTINAQGANEIQTLLGKINNEAMVIGCDAYVEYRQEDSIGDTKAWCQQDVFVMEITGDYHCINGGLEELEKQNQSNDSKKILLIYNQSLQLNHELLKDLEPVLRSENYNVYVISK